MSDLIQDVSEATFMADVVEASSSIPVIVDFWAPWCGPCKQLMPVLERAVMAAQGKVKLVKVNIDDNPGIAQQLRVQSVPTVYAFKDGQPVDGFMGAQPESELKKFIGRLTGDSDGAAEAAELIARAQGSLAAGDIGGAAQDFAGALQLDPDNAAGYAGLARIALDSGDIEQARGMLSQIPDHLRDHADIKSLQAAIGLQDDAPDNTDTDDGGLSDLRAAVEASPNDHDARLALSKALAAQGEIAEAMDHVLHSIALDRSYNDEAARLFLLTLFEAEGTESELSKEGRRRLSSILFA